MLFAQQKTFLKCTDLSCIRHNTELGYLLTFQHINCNFSWLSLPKGSSTFLCSGNWLKIRCLYVSLSISEPNMWHSAFTWVEHSKSKLHSKRIQKQIKFRNAFCHLFQNLVFPHHFSHSKGGARLRISADKLQRRIYGLKRKEEMRDSRKSV